MASKKQCPHDSPSVFKGPEPLVERCEDEKAEADAIVAWVQMIMTDHHLATHEICIAPRKAEIVTALTAAGIGTRELRPREVDPGGVEAGVRLGTMHRIKGLEYRAVGMACADPKDAMNHLEQADTRERCVRYVAATRAREHLLVTVSARKDGS